MKMNHKLIFVTLLNTMMLCLVTCETEFERFDRLFGAGAQREAMKQSQASGNPRIVGGETSPQHYAYMISLQMQSRGGGGGFPFFFQQPRSNNSHFCGGSIYSENYIITAARECEEFGLKTFQSIRINSANETL